MQKDKVIVAASGNAGKIREISEILNDYRVISCKELGFTEDIEETGKTFYDNALIKAETVAKALNMPALADDSGLCVTALSGAPGVYSARYSGTGTDETSISFLKKRKTFQTVPQNSSARSSFIIRTEKSFPRKGKRSEKFSAPVAATAASVTIPCFIATI